MLAQAREVRPGDKIAGWNEYTVVGWSAHPQRPDDGKITLRPDRPTTAGNCWTPMRADEQVEILNRDD